jgi:hypothetical protein
MSQLARKFLRIFGGDVTPTGNTAEFGSCVEGNPQYSSDPADIQSRSAFLGGFRSAVFASRFPFLEDMQALFFLATRQLAYLYQQGVPEWDATTEYHAGSVVQSGGGLYVSRADTNLNHAVSESAWWASAGTPAADRSLAGFKPTAALITRAIGAFPTYSSSSTLEWNAVCWSPELGLFAAVSTSIMTSTNGTTWTNRTAPSANVWRGICWSPELGLFAAVSETGGTDRIMTSPNGVTWTARTSPNAGLWDVCWSPELGLFCAVSDSETNGRRAVTSPDGVTWTTQLTDATLQLFGVCWSPERRKFCAVGAWAGFSRAMYSANGVDWYQGQLEGEANNWWSVCWAAEIGIFCAVGALDGSSGACIATSVDGETWTVQPPISDYEFRRVSWSPELQVFCAAAYDVFDGGNAVFISTDGVNWTSRTTPTGHAYGGVCWSPRLGIFCLVSFYTPNATQVLTSRRVRRLL